MKTGFLITIIIATVLVFALFWAGQKFDVSNLIRKNQKQNKKIEEYDKKIKKSKLTSMNL